MDLNPDTWGTVADWVGGIGTTLAFLATAAVIYRDSKVRREAQARKIAYYFREVDRSPEEVQGRYKKWWVHEVHNLSDEPIYRVQHHEVSHRGTRVPMHLRFREVLLPGESFAIQEAQYPSKSRREIQFLDNSGRPWIRTLRGELKELRRLAEWSREVVPFRLSYRAYERTEQKIFEQQSQFRHQEGRAFHQRNDSLKPGDVP